MSEITEILAGSTDIPVMFAVNAVITDITTCSIGYIRWTENDATSFSESSMTMLTELATKTTAHTDNYGIVLANWFHSEDERGYTVRVDIPDAAFATGADRLILILGVNLDVNDVPEEVVKLEYALTTATASVSGTYNGFIYFSTDGDTIANGNTGKDESPLSSWSDVMTKVGSTEIKRVVVMKAEGGLTLSGVTEPIEIISVNKSGIDMDGLNLAECTIIGATLYSGNLNTGDALRLIDCDIMENNTYTNLYCTNCRLSGTKTLADTTNTFIGCSNKDGGSLTIALNVNSSILNLLQFTGALTISSIATSDTINLSGSGKVTFTGDAGTVNLSGDWEVVNTAGCTINRAEIGSVDVISLNSDSDAVDNLRDMFNGTGYTDGAAPATQDDLTAVASDVTAIDGNVDSILEDTGTTIPASLTTIDDEIAVIDGNVDSILEDTGTTIPTSLTTIDNEIAVIDGNVDSILEDTGTTIPASLSTIDDEIAVIDGNVDSILEDTGTTIPGAISTIDNEIETIDTVVDAIKAKTDGLNFSGNNVLADVRASVIGGYQNGYVYFNESASNTNTDLWIDGTLENPVSSESSALTIATSLRTKKIYCLNGSTFEAPSDISGYIIDGGSWVFEANGQTLNSTIIRNSVSVSGTGVATGTWPNYLFIEDSYIAFATLPGLRLKRCYLNGSSIVAASAGSFYMDDCRDSFAGESITTPAFDFDIYGATSYLSIKNYMGDIEIKNARPGTEIHIQGSGKIVLNANCTGGIIAIQGNFEIDDNSSGMTMRDEANFNDHDNIASVLEDTGTTIPASLTTIDDEIAIIDGNVDSILTDTAEIGTAGAGLTAITYKTDLLNFDGNNVLADLRAINAEDTDDYNAHLKLKCLDVQNDAGSAIIAKALASGNGHGIDAAGDGAGLGVRITGGATAPGLRVSGGATSGGAVELTAPADGIGLNIQGKGTAKPGVNISGGAADASNGVTVSSGTLSGNAIEANGYGSGKSGIVAVSVAGDGPDISAKELVAIQAKTDTLPHSLKKNTAVAGYKLVMFDAITGEPKAGLTVTTQRKLDADAAWATMTGATVDNGNGVYSKDIDAADTNGLTGVWRFTAPGAKDTLVTFITEN